VSSVCGHFYSSESTYEAEYQHFLRGQEGLLLDRSIPKIKFLGPEQNEALAKLAKLPAFKHLVKEVQRGEFQTFLNHVAPEQDVPKLWEEDQPMCKLCFACGLESEFQHGYSSLDRSSPHNN
jgi:hypothetical protein